MCDCCSGEQGVKLNILVEQVSVEELRQGIRALQTGVVALAKDEQTCSCGLTLAILEEMLHLKFHEAGEEHHHSHGHHHDHHHHSEG